MSELRWLAEVLRTAVNDAGDLRATAQLANQYRQALKKIEAWESSQPVRGGQSLAEVLSSPLWEGFVYELFDVVAPNVGTDSPAFQAMVDWQRALSEEADPG